MYCMKFQCEMAKGIAITHVHMLIKLAIPSHLVGNISSRYIHADCQPLHGAYEFCILRLLYTGAIPVAPLQLWMQLGECFVVWPRLALPSRGRCQWQCTIDCGCMSISNVTPLQHHMAGLTTPLWCSMDACRSISVGKWVTIHDRAMRVICIYGLVVGPLVGSVGRLGSQVALFARPQNSLVNLLPSSALTWHTHTHTHPHTHIQSRTLCKNSFSVHFSIWIKRKLVRILNANATQRRLTAVQTMRWARYLSWLQWALTKSSTQIVVRTARLKTKLVFF